MKPTDKIKLIEDTLYEACYVYHSTCNSKCPVYEANGNKVPDTAKNFNINHGCDCFKNGKKMREFCEAKGKKFDVVMSPIVTIDGEAIIN